MAYQGYQGYTGPSQDAIARRQQVIDALTMNAADTSPKGLGPGLAQIGQALIARGAQKRLDRQESEGRAQASQQIAALLGGSGAAPGGGAGASPSGIDPAMLGAMDNPYTTEGQRAIVQMLMEQRMGEVQTQRDQEKLRAQAEQMGLTDPRQLGLFMANPEAMSGAMAKGYEPANIAAGGMRYDPMSGSAVTAPTSEIQTLQALSGDPTLSAMDMQRRRAGASQTSVNVDNMGTIPPGYELFTDPQTGARRMQPIPGSPAAQDAADAETQAANQQAIRERSADVVTQDVDRVLNLVSSSPVPTTGFGGFLTQRVPGNPGYDVSKLLDGIRANVGFDKLQQMREASPTGGALGAVSERENTLLQSTLGSLEQSQTREQFEYNLRRVANTYLDIVHGPGNGPARYDLNAAGSAPRSGQPGGDSLTPDEMQELEQLRRELRGQ